MLWRDDHAEIEYTDVIELDLGTVEPTISGPKRPQDKILLREAKPQVNKLLDDFGSKRQSIAILTNKYACGISLNQSGRIHFNININAVAGFDIIKISVLSKSRIQLIISNSDDEFMVSSAKSHSFRQWLDK